MPRPDWPNPCSAGFFCPPGDGLCRWRTSHLPSVSSVGDRGYCARLHPPPAGTISSPGSQARPPETSLRPSPHMPSIQNHQPVAGSRLPVTGRPSVAWPGTQAVPAAASRPVLHAEYTAGGSPCLALTAAGAADACPSSSPGGGLRLRFPHVLARRCPAGRPPARIGRQSGRLLGLPSRPAGHAGSRHDAGQAVASDRTCRFAVVRQPAGWPASRLPPRRVRRPIA